MPGIRITPEKRRRFFYLTTAADGPAMSPTRAAEELGFSSKTAYRLMGAIGRSATEQGRVAARDLPDPKTYDELDGAIKDMLRPDGFNDFAEAFFARIPSPWRLEAAKLTIGALLTPEREFWVENVFPGSGKTTLWHDIEAWLICGGGFEDPSRGRAIRIMNGSETLKVATHSTVRLRRTLERSRPFYDKFQQRYAELVLTNEFGRFKPDTTLGEESIWANDQFLVAQLVDRDVYEKEPTVQVASYESGFLGERVDLGVWDDLATKKNSRSPATVAPLDEFVEDEAETRVEPDGAFFAVGQRLSPYDIFRKRLDAVFDDEDQVSRPLYKHITFPAHFDELCDGTHRQWNGIRPPSALADGCMTDIRRLPVKDWRKRVSSMNYDTVYQQKDVDPSSVLVRHAWLDGGMDEDGYPAPGSFDRDRGFFEWPSGAGKLIDYASVDPAAGNWWALEWWATPMQLPPEAMRFRWLIYGKRMQIPAGKYLDWDNQKQDFTGIMHELQMGSIAAGHPIRVWVVEQNAAHTYLFQFEHYRRWRQRFPMVHVLTHQTGVNKLDPERGVQGMQMPYKQGLKRLPRKEGDLDALNYMRTKISELTSYQINVRQEGFDTVLADWFGEHNLPRIIELGKRELTSTARVDVKLPPYLQKQLKTQYYGEEE